MRCKVADLIVGSSNFIFSFWHPIGLGIVLSNEQLGITKIVVFKFQKSELGCKSYRRIYIYNFIFLQLVMIT